MINREITYKRDINSSYMIIPAMPEESFDEKVLLKRTIGDLLSVEKCYEASVGQYWYDITGKQALDSYCRINSIGKDFFENLILKICQMVEQLEWNLVDINCLVLDPELVFLNAYGEELAFVAYPFHKGDLATELQQLLEYLLTKLNHKDTIAVGWAYKLYEMALMDGMSIAELKRVILEDRTQNLEIEPKVVNYIERTSEVQAIEPVEMPEATAQKSNGMLDEVILKCKEMFQEKTKGYYDKVQGMIQTYFLTEREARKEVPVVVYPEETEEEEVIEIHPTVCIAAVKGTGKELCCDRKGVFPDFILERSAYIVGKSAKVQFRIDKDTVSQFHARIEYQGDAYYIEDLNSTNGTYVNEQLLSYKSRRLLQSGDSIRFGDVGYHFY